LLKSFGEFRNGCDEKMRTITRQVWLSNLHLFGTYPSVWMIRLHLFEISLLVCVNVSYLAYVNIHSPPTQNLLLVWQSYLRLIESITLHGLYASTCVKNIRPFCMVLKPSLV